MLLKAEANNGVRYVLVITFVHFKKHSQLIEKWNGFSSAT